MNCFNAIAAACGREFAEANSAATCVDIDRAATAHSPIDPARRHFQDAAHAELRRMEEETSYYIRNR